jgi:DNA-binding PadR family transcriptional regulator
MKRPTPKTLEILRLLAAHPRGLYGLQLVDKSQGRVKRGSVYVYLGRLKDDGLVKVAGESAPAGAGGLPRPLYRITAIGRRVLDAEEAYAFTLAQASP